MSQASSRSPDQGVRRFIRWALDQSVLLPVGAIIGLVWANSAHETYEHFSESLHFLVNDVGMVFFFALATKEVVEATAPGGALSSPRQASVPVLAAVGGMAGPALIYVGLVIALGVPELHRGWAIPCATDIAFSYLTAQFVLGPRHPAIPFLLLLAIADDAFGLVILAAFYPAGEVRVVELSALLALAFAVCYILRRRRVKNFWPYLLIGGGLSWVALERGGLHPALALVPIVPFLPHAARDPDLFLEDPAAPDTLNEMEHWWKLPVQGVLFAFGLVNAGVPVTDVGIGTWIVLSAIMVGKPVGIGSVTLASRLVGLRLPPGLGWREVIVVSVAAAIGFTVALFFATAAFPPGLLLNETKTGALLSVLASGATALAAYVLRVGRYARNSPTGTQDDVFAMK